MVRTGCAATAALAPATNVKVAAAVSKFRMRIKTSNAALIAILGGRGNAGCHWATKKELG
jgi:hypothetical protein